MTESKTKGAGGGGGGGGWGGEEAVVGGVGEGGRERGRQTD